MFSPRLFVRYSTVSLSLSPSLSLTIALSTRLLLFLHRRSLAFAEPLSPSTVVIRDSSAAIRNRSASVSVRTKMAVTRFLSHPSANVIVIYTCIHHSQCFLSRSSIVHASQLFACMHLALLIRDHGRCAQSQRQSGWM